ncbi:MAG: hypothetical protein R6X22_00190 [Gemmatimonadota bacterium]
MSATRLSAGPSTRICSSVSPVETERTFASIRTPAPTCTRLPRTAHSPPAARAVSSAVARSAVAPSGTRSDQRARTVP